MKERIAIASDHAGFHHKQMLKAYLTEKGYSVADFGTDSDQSVDYPLFIRPAAEAVARGECDVGIVLGGSGNGEAIVSNKVKGVRCAVCWNVESAVFAKEHNNANVIAMGERLVAPETAKQVVDAWLGAAFQGGRHQRRVDEIAEMER